MDFSRLFSPPIDTLAGLHGLMDGIALFRGSSFANTQLLLSLGRGASLANTLSNGKNILLSYSNIPNPLLYDIQN